jgi:hypothetical protein
LLQLFFRYAVAERMGTIILSAIVAHTAWHWMLDRGSVLRQFRFEWPTLNAGLLALVMRWLVLFMILGGLLWLVRMASQKWAARTGSAQRPSAKAVASPDLTPLEPTGTRESHASFERPN